MMAVSPRWLGRRSTGICTAAARSGGAGRHWLAAPSVFWRVEMTVSRRLVASGSRAILGGNGGRAQALRHIDATARLSHRPRCCHKTTATGSAAASGNGKFSIASHAAEAESSSAPLDTAVSALSPVASEMRLEASETEVMVSQSRNARRHSQIPSPRVRSHAGPLLRLELQATCVGGGCVWGALWQHLISDHVSTRRSC